VKFDCRVLLCVLLSSLSAKSYIREYESRLSTANGIVSNSNSGLWEELVNGNVTSWM